MIVLLLLCLEHFHVKLKRLGQIQLRHERFVHAFFLHGSSVSMVVAYAARVRVVVLVNGQSFLHVLHLVLQLEVPSPQLLDLEVGLGRRIQVVELAGDSSSALL